MAFQASCFSTLLVFCLMAAQEASAVAIRTVALSGGNAPGAAAGAVYQSFSPPVINDRGEVAFTATLLTGSGGVTYAQGLGIWAEGEDGLRLVAQSGMQAPGTPEGVNFRGWLNLNLNNQGQVTFEGSLGTRSPPSRIVATSSDIDAQSDESLSSLNDTGIWLETDGTLQMVLRKGQAVPGRSDGATFHSFAGRFGQSDGSIKRGPYLVISDAGEVVFPALIQFESSPLRRGEVWVSGPDGLRSASTSLEHISSLPPGSSLGISAGPPSVGPDGTIAFSAFVRCEACMNQYQLAGIWKLGEEGPAPVVLTGDPAPGTASDAIFGTQFAPPMINSFGETAFRGVWYSEELRHAEWALWSDAGGTLRNVAAKGREVPVAHGTAELNDFLAPHLNDQGYVVFQGALSRDSEGISAFNDTAVWQERNGELRLIAQEGEQAPGTPPGTVFGGGFDFSLNRGEQIILVANLRSDEGDVDRGNDVGVWVGNLGEELSLLVREGDEIEISPGVRKTIEELVIWPPGSTDRNLIGLTGGSDGRPRLFNGRGEVAFKAMFTDDSSGLFVASLHPIPEPSTVAGWVVLLGTGFLATPRWRYGI